jgi:hypothetical protein
MRNKHSGSSLSIRAIAGTHVVTLAWDLKQATFDTTDLLGFAIERTKFESLARTTVKERFFLRGIKRSRKDRGLPAGTVPTSEHRSSPSCGRLHRGRRPRTRIGWSRPPARPWR